MSNDESIMDVLHDLKYKNKKPHTVISRVRIPGTTLIINRGDKVYVDEANNRMIIESSTPLQTDEK